MSLSRAFDRNKNILLLPILEDDGCFTRRRHSCLGIFGDSTIARPVIHGRDIPISLAYLCGFYRGILSNSRLLPHNRSFSIHKFACLFTIKSERNSSTFFLEEFLDCTWDRHWHGDENFFIAQKSHFQGVLLNGLMVDCCERYFPSALVAFFCFLAVREDLLELKAPPICSSLGSSDQAAEVTSVQRGNAHVRFKFIVPTSHLIT